MGRGVFRHRWRGYYGRRRPAAAGKGTSVQTISVSFSLAATGTKHASGTGTITLSLTPSGSGIKHAPGAGAIGVAFSLVGSGTKHTGIGMSPRPRARWMLIAGPRTGGYEDALTTARGRRFAFKLDEPDDLQFTIDGRHLDVEALDELATDVHVLRLDADDVPQPLSRMRVGNTGDDFDENNRDEVSVTGLDYRAILNGRILWSYSQLTWTAIDQAELAWGLVQQTQQLPGGDLGIVKGWVGTTPTGVILDERIYEAGDKIGERITELSERVGGFDWDLVPVSASALQMDVWAERGVNRGVVLETGGLVAKGRREVNVSSYANATRYTGSSDPATTPVELEAPELTGAYGVPIPPQGRWEAAFGDDGLITQSALQDRAEWQLATSQVPQPVYTLTLKPGAWQGPDHIWLGDPVLVVPRSGRLRNVAIVQRVHEIAVTLGESGQETVEITTGGRRPDYRRRPREVERRLQNLERR